MSTECTAPTRILSSCYQFLIPWQSDAHWYEYDVHNGHREYAREATSGNTHDDDYNPLGNIIDVNNLHIDILVIIGYLGIPANDATTQSRF